MAYFKTIKILTFHRDSIIFVLVRMAAFDFTENVPK